MFFFFFFYPPADGENNVKDGLVSKLLLLQRSLFFRIDGHAHPERQHSRNVWYGGVTNCDRFRHKQLAAA